MFYKNLFDDPDSELSELDAMRPEPDSLFADLDPALTDLDRILSDMDPDYPDADPPPADTYLDVPFVPSDEAVVEAMLDLAEAGPQDVLYDLGSGDGRIVVAAARDRGARAVGIELDLLRIAEAMEYAAYSRVENQVDFREEDLFTADLSEATIVTLYLLHSVNVELRPRLLSQLRPGTRIVSHAFDMGDWKADKRLEVGGIRIHKWIVPASVAGTWTWEASDGTPYRVELTQQYQQVSGRAWQGDEAVTLARATLRGSYLEVDLRDETRGTRRRFTLHVSDHEMKPVLE